MECLESIIWYPLTWMVALPCMHYEVSSFSRTCIEIQVDKEQSKFLFNYFSNGEQAVQLGEVELYIFEN